MGGVKISNLSITEYLLENDITVTNRMYSISKDRKKEDIIMQMKLGNAVHNILMGYTMNNNTRINSTIGKKIEGVKVDIKRSKFDLYSLSKKEEKNKIDIFLLSNGEEIIKRAEEGLKYLSEINLLSLIERSMKRNEISLGRIDEENLRARENIEIASIKGLSYNLLEEDIYNYLRRIRKNENNINYNDVIYNYLNISSLSFDSKCYIDILLFIPFDTLKYWKRYKNNKITDCNKYIEKLIKSYNYEIGGAFNDKIS